MAKNLLIVESPAKVKTIRGFLGDKFIVAASLGHIRDLPERELSIDLSSFRPHYTVLPGKSEIVKRLKSLVKETEALYLATDPDREGEAIAWHLVEVLKPRCPVFRVTFNTITEAAVKAALQSPRRIDMALVNAQQARRIVDRLVGYELSPLLWGRFEGEGLSAGRVQTIGLRLVVEREQEIQTFTSEAYWTLDADFEARDGTFTARLVRWRGAEVALKDEATTRAIMTALGAARFSVQSITHQERERRPQPPFITSTLQQAASTLLGFSPDKTMRLAQELYEGVSAGGTHQGLITYLRTDAVQIAPEAQRAAADFIRTAYGDSYLPPKPPNYQAKPSAQEAHEAIRPTDVRHVSDGVKGALSDDLHALYTLIWSRFLASQMAAARFAETMVMVSADDAAVFRARGRTSLFDGFLRVYAHEEEKASDDDQPDKKPLPELHQDEGLLLTGWSPVERFTRPPGRYTEASLIQALEKQGIGRPSTYASTLATLKVRGYVEIGKERKLMPTARGAAICEFLTTQFIDIFAYDFTARLENELDAIAYGKADWVEVLRRFWQTVEPYIQASAAVKVAPEHAPSTPEACPECGQPLRQRTGKNGTFLGCSGYPDCRYTRSLDAAKTNHHSSAKRRKMR